MIRAHLKTQTKEKRTVPSRTHFKRRQTGNEIRGGISVWMQLLKLSPVYCKAAGGLVHERKHQREENSTSAQEDYHNNFYADYHKKKRSFVSAALLGGVEGGLQRATGGVLK